LNTDVKEDCPSGKGPAARRCPRGKLVTSGQSLDQEAKRLGVTRQSIIKLWLADRLKEASA
jgi:hypothetical protein